MAAVNAPTLKRAGRLGTIAGFVAVFLSVTGAVQAFQRRDVVTEVIGLGEAMLTLIVLAAGYFIARPPRTYHHAEVEALKAPPRGVLAAGALGGLVAGAVLGAFLLVASAVSMRSVLVNVTPELLETLSFGLSTAAAAVVLAGGGAVLGLLGAGAHLLSPTVRRPLFTALLWILIFALFAALLRQIIGYFFLTDWLFSGTGLTTVGAVVVAVAAAVLSETSKTVKPVARTSFRAMPQNQQLIIKVVVFVVVALLLFVLPDILGVFMSEVVGTVGLYILLGLGLNIVVGYAGLLDLGYVAFFAIGAYSAAILTSPAGFGSLELSFWWALPLVIVITTIGGILIGAPVLRLRGDYLAIVTLGFGEIIRVLVQSNWLSGLTGGAQGITRIPDPVIFGREIDQSTTLYYLILVAVLIAAFVSWRVQYSRVGRAWNSMREDESVAEAMGVSIIKYKLLAFGTGAAIGSLGGAFFATKIGSVFPASFGLIVSINVLALIILGGMGNIPGVIIGAFVLVGLPELLREFDQFRLLFYGAILVAIMILKPEGLLPSARRRAELYVEEAPEEQYERRAGAEETPGPVVTAGAGETR